jgi:hypothetical protein
MSARASWTITSLQDLKLAARLKEKETRITFDVPSTEEVGRKSTKFPASSFGREPTDIVPFDRTIRVDLRPIRPIRPVL